MLELISICTVDALINVVAEGCDMSVVRGTTTHRVGRISSWGTKSFLSESAFSSRLLYGKFKSLNRIIIRCHPDFNSKFMAHQDTLIPP